MIIIKNTQRKIKINTKKIENYINQLLEILKYQDFDIGIWFTTNATIKNFNKNFRKKDKPTDILSFPFYPDLKPGERIQIPLELEETQNGKKLDPKPELYPEPGPESQDAKNLGDIIISLEYAKNWADKNSANFDEHLKVLLVHGICHLIGYDHETEQDYKLMHKKELALLEKINL